MRKPSDSIFATTSKHANKRATEAWTKVVRGIADTLPEGYLVASGSANGDQLRLVIVRGEVATGDATVAGQP